MFPSEVKLSSADRWAYPAQKIGRNKVTPTNLRDDFGSPPEDNGSLRNRLSIGSVAKYSRTSLMSTDSYKQLPKDEFLYLYAFNSVLHILIGVAYISSHMYLDDLSMNILLRWPSGIYPSLPALIAGWIGVVSVTNVLELHSRVYNNLHILCSIFAMLLSLGILIMSPFGSISAEKSNFSEVSATDFVDGARTFTSWPYLDQSLFVIAWIELVVSLWSVILGSVVVNKSCRARIGGYVDIESDLTNSMICLGVVPEQD